MGLRVEHEGEMQQTFGNILFGHLEESVLCTIYLSILSARVMFRSRRMWGSGTHEEAVLKVFTEDNSLFELHKINPPRKLPCYSLKK